MSARAGQSVNADDKSYQLWSAAPDGHWWAIPTGGGQAVRLRRIRGAWHLTEVPAAPTPRSGA